ncbi:hypothetical protein K469DRAFT_652259 [Zopfia rhizophila CBS 207.26]|uniref:Mediator of RNA polymerase II transcription subunit 1 n=1 Tax=Zopfia rhizophila CBS 207.26 TaxID=1314779 RepID=A0A6A6EV08_9PEZI|nr:hypothetical protein K469DRAFT_652259 [Zopfia rhizophila CBS 207.26]
MATPTPSTNTPQKHLAAFSSPAPRSLPGMINFDSPAALGLSLEGGVGMGISMSGMSGLGLSASAIGRADEEERRRRLESVIATLKTRPGRVSEEGIIGLCKKEGLEVVKEPQGKEEENRMKLILLIGNEGMCEIPMRNGEIENVNLELASDRSDISFGPTGSQILLRDLRPLPGMAKINLTLERFSHNLDKLLRMDKLSSQGASCFQAVFGIYTSLRKLFEHEKKIAVELLDAKIPYTSQRAEREVLCKKSGRPRMNAEDGIGLALEYWMDRRYLIPKYPQAKKSVSLKGKEKMDIDSDDTSNCYPEDQDPSTNKIYSMTIECESSQSAMYPPIRISDAWISENITKAADATDSNIDDMLMDRPSIDWLEPPQTYLPSAGPEEHDAMNLDTAPGRLPNIRFIAKFNPPLVVPLSVAVTIHQSLSNEIPNDSIRPTTFVGLALRPGEADPGVTGLDVESVQEIRNTRTVLAYDRDGKEEQHIHSNSLYVPKTEYARTIEVLPFSHPRQLIEILPTLRQYAFLTNLLVPLSPPLTSMKSNADALQLDITLSYAQPTPRLTMHLPHPSSSPPTSNLSSAASILDSIMGSADTDMKPPIGITVDIMTNADLMISDQNVVPARSALETKDVDVDMVKGAGEHDKLVQRLAKALDVCGELGVWGEWVRREIQRQDG